MGSPSMLSEHKYFPLSFGKNRRRTTWDGVLVMRVGGECWVLYRAEESCERRERGRGGVGGLQPAFTHQSLLASSFSFLLSYTQRLPTVLFPWHQLFCLPPPIVQCNKCHSPYLLSVWRLSGISLVHLGSAAVKHSTAGPAFPARRSSVRHVSCMMCVDSYCTLRATVRASPSRPPAQLQTSQ